MSEVQSSDRLKDKEIAIDIQVVGESSRPGQTMDNQNQSNCSESNPGANLDGGLSEVCTSNSEPEENFL